MDFSKVPIKKVKEFWDRSPCNIRHSPNKCGTREYFDEMEKRKYFVEPHILRFAEFDRWRDKNVLEIGCGIGTDTINFARHGAKVTAVELSSRSLEIARCRAEVYGLKDNIKFYCGDAQELDKFLPVEPYDLIYSFGVIHHAPQPERIISQLTKYMRSGSLAKIMVYHRYSWKVFKIFTCYAKGRFLHLKRLVADHSEAQKGSPVTYTFTRKQIAEALERYGLEVTDMWVDHIFPYRIAEYKHYRYVKVWYFRSMPSLIFRWLQKNFGWHLCITAKKSSGSAGGPFHEN